MDTASEGSQREGNLARGGGWLGSFSRAIRVLGDENLDCGSDRGREKGSETFQVKSSRTQETA